MLRQMGRRRAQKRTPRVCSRRLRGIESGANLKRGRHKDRDALATDSM